jgi:hypothetical protein
MATYLPPGWPTGVHPPGSQDFERTAVAWLMDVVPPDYRLYGVLRRHPAALASLARHHLAACVEGARQGYRTARTELGNALPPHGVDAVLAAYRSEGRRLVATATAVGLVERALQGETFRPRLRESRPGPGTLGPGPEHSRAASNGGSSNGRAASNGTASRSTAAGETTRADGTTATGKTTAVTKPTAAGEVAAAGEVTTASKPAAAGEVTAASKPAAAGETTAVGKKPGSAKGGGSGKAAGQSKRARNGTPVSTGKGRQLAVASDGG